MEDEFIVDLFSGKTINVDFETPPALRAMADTWKHTHTADFEWLTTQLKRFTYKPGWTFEIRLPDYGFSRFGEFMLYITMRVEDTYHPGRMVEVFAAKPIYAMDHMDHNETAFAHMLAGHILEVEHHESREWLRRDGDIYDNPHK